jgi:hypothetical protein
MDINIGTQQDLRYPAARFNEKECLQVWVGDKKSEILKQLASYFWSSPVFWFGVHPCEFLWLQACRNKTA